MVPAPDFSSYQIYVFAGVVGTPEVRQLDMYVLSVPAFIWTKVPVEGYPEKFGLGDHSCECIPTPEFVNIG